MFRHGYTEQNSLNNKTLRSKLCYVEQPPKRMLQEDWSNNKTELFKRLAAKQMSTAGFLAEPSQRALCSQPSEIHETLHKHWVKAYFVTTMTKTNPLGIISLTSISTFLATKRLHVFYPPLPPASSVTGPGGEGGRPRPRWLEV